MSNIYVTGKIPTLEAERPVKTFNGMILANEAWYCRLEDLWPAKAGDTPPREEWRRAIDLYLGNYCRPIKSIAREVRCVACNTELTAPQGVHDKRALIVNTETETLESKCPGCGYPVRARHVMTLPKPDQHVVLVRLDFFPLCYHPSATERKAGGILH